MVGNTGLSNKYFQNNNIKMSTFSQIRLHGKKETALLKGGPQNRGLFIIS